MHTHKENQVAQMCWSQQLSKSSCVWISLAVINEYIETENIYHNISLLGDGYDSNIIWKVNSIEFMVALSLSLSLSFFPPLICSLLFLQLWTLPDVAGSQVLQGMNKNRLWICWDKSWGHMVTTVTHKQKQIG